MVTGASTADLAIVLVDARNGVRRADAPPRLHRVAARHPAPRRRGQQDGPRRLLRGGLRRDRARLLRASRSQLGVRDIAFVPISALHGDNVVERSERDAVVRRPAAARAPRDASRSTADRNLDDAALPGPVRHPRRRQRLPRLRRPGGRRRAAPRRRGRSCCPPSASTTDRRRSTPSTGPLDAAVPADERHACAWPTSSTSRAATSSAAAGDRPALARELDGRRLLDGRRAAARRRRATRSSTRRTRARGDRRGDRRPRRRRRRLEPRAGAAELALNDIGRVRLRTSKPLAFDPYARNRATGSFILIDEATNDTVGAGMITARRNGAGGSVARDARRGGGAGGARRRRAAAAGGDRVRARARAGAAPRGRRRRPVRVVPRARRPQPARARAHARRSSSTSPTGCAPGGACRSCSACTAPARTPAASRARATFTQVADEHHFVVAYPMSWRARGLLALPRARQPAQRRCAAARHARRGGAHGVRRSRARARDRHLLGRADDLRRRLRAGRPAPRDRARSRAARASCRPAIPRGRSRSSTSTGPRTRSSPTAAAAPTTTGACPTSWPTGRGARAAAPSRARGASTRM